MPQARKRSKREGSLSTRFQPYRPCAPRPRTFHKFLDLPVEVRRIVYRYLLRIYGCIEGAGLWPWDCRGKPRVAILRICKQIHAEAANYLYSVNSFCLLERCDDFTDDQGGLDIHPGLRWLKRIGKVNSMFIRHLQLRVRMPERLPTYYSGLLSEIGKLSPNISRFALISEKHDEVDTNDSDSDSSDSDWTEYHWEPNQVTPLELYQIKELRQSLQVFRLETVVLAGYESFEVAEYICAVLRCEVRCIDLEKARLYKRTDALWGEETSFCALPFNEKEVWVITQAGQRGEFRAVCDNLLD